VLVGVAAVVGMVKWKWLARLPAPLLAPGHPIARHMCGPARSAARGHRMIGDVIIWTRRRLGAVIDTSS
jgi:hypothetical protein